MKILSIALSCLALFAVGGLATVLFLSLPRAVESDGAVLAPPGVPETAPASPDAEAEVRRLRDRVAMLEATFDELATQVLRIGEDVSRRPAMAAPAIGNGAPVSAAPLSADGVIDEADRQAVLAIIEEERRQREREREAERLERERQAILDRAERVARQLGLGAADEKRLGDFYFAAQTKRQDLFAELREGGADRDRFRTAMEDLRAWSEVELTRQVGAPLAQRILELEGEQRGRFGGWGGPGGDRRGGNRGRD